MTDPFKVDGKRRPATHKPADPETVPRAMEQFVPSPVDKSAKKPAKPRKKPAK